MRPKSYGAIFLLKSSFPGDLAKFAMITLDVRLGLPRAVEENLPGQLAWAWQFKVNTPARSPRPAMPSDCRWQP